MADNAQDSGPAASGSRSGEFQYEFGIQRIYLKDASFEAPNSPAIFGGGWTPEVTVQLGSTAQALKEGLYEVILTVTVTAKAGERVAYLTEVQQAGLFGLNGFDDASLGSMLGSYCPNLLFAYAREAVTNLVGKGGFPALNLLPVNFDALYAQRLQQERQRVAPAS